ncbi:MAG: signal recognition particle-docking protein FtsY [Candidatus Micrarchaeales archaeon]|jgi:fused signal recognition particle receptor
MFEGLKKKFSDFVEGLSKKEEKEEKQEETKKTIEKKEERKMEEKTPDVSIVTKIKGTFLGKVKISEKDAEPFLEQLHIALLQTDVNYDVADKIVNKLKSNLVGKELEAKEIQKSIREEIRNSLLQILTKNSGMDLMKLAKEKKEKGEKPFKMLFLGPNGAGKTTTIAKIAKMLSINGLSCVISASDTFRAAAIEQAAFHAKKLGIDVIKGNYGADPASIAFDAVAYAKAHGIDVVLIDTAGRQETNRNLIEELKKMVRVNKPDVSIFIGEGIAGNALLEQVKQFNEAAKLDGVILTKLDVDAKGGNTLSILSDTDVPVIYFGMGEKYSDLMPYDPKFVVDNIIPA